MLESGTNVNYNIYMANCDRVKASSEYMQIISEIDEQIRFVVDFADL